MNRIISTVVAAIIMLATFTTTANAAKKVGNTIYYTVLNNYFHNNNVPIPSSPLITTKKEFDEQFGMAARMGKDGLPTPVNFKKEAVIAIVLPETDVVTEIDSISVKETGANELTLTYNIHEGMKNGFTTQPMFLMAVNKKYKNYKVKVVAKTYKDVKVNKASSDFVSYSDSRNNIYLNIDYPTGGDAKVVKAVRMWIAGQLGDMANGFSLAKMDSRHEIAKSADDNSNLFLQKYVGIIADSMNVLNHANAKYGSPMRCSLNANISRVYEDSKIVSYESDGYNFTGGAHGLSFCHGATFDKATGKQIDIVKDSLPLRKMITDRLHKTCDMQGLHFEQEPVPMPSAKPYVVSGGKIKFVYQPYEIGAYALGKPECEFSSYELDGYLTKEGKTLIP